MKYIYKILLLIALCTNSYAGINGVGNGGSGEEAKLAATQTEIELISLKLKRFFQNNIELEDIFYEFNRKELISAIQTTLIQVQDISLVDKNGVSRTCINKIHPKTIVCNLDFKKLDKFPESKFVLLLHEYLGIIGIEETSPKNPSVYEGYKISGKLSAFVSKVANYDLSLQPKETNDIYLTSGFYHTPDMNIYLNHSSSGLYLRGILLNNERYKDNSAPMIRANKIGNNRYELKIVQPFFNGEHILAEEHNDICSVYVDNFQSRYAYPNVVVNDCAYILTATQKLNAKAGDKIQVKYVFHIDSPETMDMWTMLSLFRDGKLINQVNMFDIIKNERLLGRAYRYKSF